MFSAFLRTQKKWQRKKIYAPCQMLHFQDTQKQKSKEARNTETRPIGSKSNVKNDHATMKMCKRNLILPERKCDVRALRPEHENIGVVVLMNALAL